MNSEFQGNDENNFVNSKLQRNGEKKYSGRYRWTKWTSVLKLHCFFLNIFIWNKTIKTPKYKRRSKHIQT